MAFHVDLTLPAFLLSLDGKRKQASCISPVDGAVSPKSGSEAIFALPPHIPSLFILFSFFSSLQKHTLSESTYQDLNESLNNITGICASR